ncbi:uncharacterized protein LOC100121810 isoform X2 [Nasonia vitripennis]|uniref:Uncharacterized protein n=1 Tax=Nasonia vitripennis TaxID=7425 RepID=A0A7M7IPQ8_NASVI|nr:uncharacterized protein LOC100121810 isoform X2 [Nasonia vitripennis]
MADPQRNRLNSIVITGSDMNHRTFGEEELWNSLQSTVLAGNLTMNDALDVKNVEQIKDLTTVDEESLSEDKGDRTQYEDILNMNICAIGSDDEAFFDCPSYSPRYSPRKLKSPTLGASFKYSPKYSPMKSKLSPSSANYGNFLTTDSASEIKETSTSDGGLDERTGFLLAQIVDDFNNIRSEAQSTPNLDQDISEDFSVFKRNISKNSEHCKDSKRKLSFASEEPAAREKAAKAKSKKGVNSPVEWKPARRVARMKEFFENKSRSAEESRNNQTSRTSSCAKKSFIPKLSSSSSRVCSSSTRIAPKLMKTRFHSRSPSYKIISVPKLVITPVRRSIASPASKNGSRSLRASSCSEYPPESSETNYSQRSRSHSASEIESNASAGANNSTKLINSSRLRNTTRAYYFITNRKSTLHRNSPKGQSAISKRRSVGVAAKSKSPIKPVRELRKVFSPSSKPTVINQTKSIRSKLI